MAFVPLGERPGFTLRYIYKSDVLHRSVVARARRVSCKSQVDLTFFVRLSGAGLMYGAEGDWVAWLYGNLILVTLGNIVGGGLVVGTHFTGFTGKKLFVQNY